MTRKMRAINSFKLCCLLCVLLAGCRPESKKSNRPYAHQNGLVGPRWSKCSRQQIRQLTDAIRVGNASLKQSLEQVETKSGEAFVKEIFGNGTERTKKIVLDTLTKMRNGIAENKLTFEYDGNTDGPNIKAFTLYKERPARIYFTSLFFEDYTVSEQALIYLHECSHVFAGTVDISYAESFGFNELKTERRLKNADHYVELIRIMSK